MKYAGYTKQERNLVALMRVLSIFFLAAAALTALIPGILLNYINDIGRVFVGWTSPPVAAGTGLWRAHSITLHLMLAYACLVAQGSSLRNARYAELVMIASAVSAVLCAAMVFVHEPQFYLAVAASVAVFIFLVTLWIYSNASRSRS